MNYLELLSLAMPEAILVIAALAVLAPISWSYATNRCATIPGQRRSVWRCRALLDVQYRASEQLASGMLVVIL